MRFVLYPDGSSPEDESAREIVAPDPETVEKQNGLTIVSAFQELVSGRGEIRAQYTLINKDNQRFVMDRLFPDEETNLEPAPSLSASR